MNGTPQSSVWNFRFTCILVIFALGFALRFWRSYFFPGRDEIFGSLLLYWLAATLTSAIATERLRRTPSEPVPYFRPALLALAAGVLLSSVSFAFGLFWSRL